MKTVADKKLVVGADFAGVALKDAVVAHLERHGWEVEDIGVKAGDPNPEMFHRIGFAVGAKISEGEYEKGIVFCGTGMGIHIAAGKCPGVQAACCESLMAARRATTGNNCNILSMGGMYVAPQLGIEMADAFLNTKMGDDYEDIEGWCEFHQLAYDEIANFDYEEYKANGFKIKDAKYPKLGQFPRP